MSKRTKGFTLVELLVVVLVIGIIAAIALPNFAAAQDKAKRTVILGGMRQIQIAAESYSTDAGGVYPPSLALMQPYFPGGSNTLAGSPGTWPSNPYINGDNFGTPDPPDDGSSITDIAAARALPAGTFTDDAGGITYDHALGPTSYAIWGCGSDGKCFGAVSGQLIYSNQ